MFHGKSHWGQKITESRPESNLSLPGITTVLHLCYTHAHARKKNPQTYEQHLSACNSRDSAKDPSGKGEVKWGENDPENNKRGQRQQWFLHVFGHTNYCWQVLCQPARSPTTSALNTLFLLFPLCSEMAIAEGRRKFGDCWAKTDHFKAAYLTLAKFFITVA